MRRSTRKGFTYTLGDAYRHEVVMQKSREDRVRGHNHDIRGVIGGLGAFIAGF